MNPQNTQKQEAFEDLRLAAEGILSTVLNNNIEIVKIERLTE
ncbi:MAG: hypothetical protein RLZZ74_246, partial [Cyanobacteriota bacterium]